SEPFNDEATTGNTIVPKGKRRIGEWADVFNFDWPEQNEVSTRLRDILESNVDEKYYLDEDKTAKLVAQLEAAEVGVQDAIEYDRKKGVGNIRDIALCLSSSDWRGLNRNQKQNAVAETIGLPIREATKKGYAIAEEGDSVNVQFPDSKTRRGRVGKQIANTLEASSINQGVVTTEEGHNGEEKERNTVEILRVLQEEIGEKEIAKWRSRILDTFQQEEILRQDVYEKRLDIEQDEKKLERKEQSCECEVKN